MKELDGELPFWELPVLFFIGPKEGGVASKAALEAGICGTLSLRNKLPGKHQPFFCNVLAQGTAGLAFKKAHHVIGTQAADAGKLLKGKLPVQIVVNVGDKAGYPVVQGAACKVLRIRCKAEAVQPDQKFLA